MPPEKPVKAAMGRGWRPRTAGDCQPEPGLGARSSFFLTSSPWRLISPNLKPQVLTWQHGLEEETAKRWPKCEERHQEEGQVVVCRSVAEYLSGASLEGDRDQKDKSQWMGTVG